MACASIQQNEYLQHVRILTRISNPVKSLLVVALLALLVNHFGTAYAALPVMMLGLVFLLITSGCSIFGLLNMRASRRLGEISYGIYILQGLALYGCFYYAPIRTYALDSVVHYWLVVTMAGLSLVTVAFIAHLTLELPGIETGKKLIKFLGRAKNLPAQT